MKTHLAAKSHTCSYCGYRALTREAVKRHTNRIHLKLRQFECEICAKTFVSQPDRKLHMLRHYKMKPVQCDECDERFYSTRELRKHKWAHTGKKPYKCDDCEVSYGYVESLRRHMATHFSEPIKCDKCSFKCWSHKAFTKHMFSHPPKDHIYKCFDCDKHFKTVRTLNSHHHKFKHSLTVVVCHECNLEFALLELLVKHNASTHKQIRTKQRTSKLNVSSKEASHLKKNVMEVFIKEKYIESVKYCSNFNSDQTSAKEDIKPYADYDQTEELHCEKCGKQFASAEDYSEHCQYVHGCNMIETYLLEGGGSIEVIAGGSVFTSQLSDSVVIKLEK